MDKEKFSFDQKDIIVYGLIAALYVVITYISYPISFMAIQFKIGEIMVLLCFFNRKYVVGLVLGCIISNLVSPLRLMDVGFELSLIGEPLWMSMGTVALGELAVMVAGYIFFMVMKRRKKFFETKRATRNIDFKF